MNRISLSFRAARTSFSSSWPAAGSTLRSAIRFI